jgi:hypothetical protein
MIVNYEMERMWLISDTIPAFGAKLGEMKNLKISGLRAEDQTRDLQNTMQEIRHNQNMCYISDNVNHCKFHLWIP